MELADLPAVHLGNPEGYACQRRFRDAVQLDDFQRGAALVDKRDLPDLSFLQRDNLFLRVKLILRRAGDLFEHIRRGVQVRQEDGAVLRDIFAHHAAVLAADTDRHAVHGVAVLIRFQNAQARLRGIFNDNVLPFSRLQLHRDGFAVQDIAGSGCDLLNHQCRHILLRQEDDTLIVRHVGLRAAGNIGLGDFKPGAKDGLFGLGINFAKVEARLRHIPQREAVGFSGVQLDGVGRIIQQIALRGFQLPHHDGRTVREIGELHGPVFIGSVDTGAAAAVAFSHKAAVAVLDLEDRPGKWFVRLVVHLPQSQAGFQLVCVGQLHRFAGEELHRARRGVDDHVLRAGELTHYIPVRHKPGVDLAVFVRCEGLRFCAVLPAELKYHIGEGFVRSLHCFPEADLGPVRFVLVDHLSNGVCFQLDGLHRVFGRQVVNRPRLCRQHKKSP